MSREAAFGKETIHEDSALIEDGEAVPEEEIEIDRGTSLALTTIYITHSIAISLTQTITMMANGNTEIERRTNFF